jgi:hypothetical protein
MEFKMKSNFLKLVMMIVVFTTTYNNNMFAGIESEFELPIITQENYQTLNPGFGVTQLAHTSFRDNFNNVNRDDGYYEYTLPWTFTFNNVDRTRLWICVNGFITFNQPLNLPQANPTNLFNNQVNSFQNNVVAPFWGDHIYRSGAAGDNMTLYRQSNILIRNDEVNERVIIEWQNLNINDKTIPSSVASFQVILYKSKNPNTRQGNIEFAYGLINTAGGTIVKTDGASIGIKGESGEYLNGLCYDPEPDNDDVPPVCDAFASQALSSVWQPSGGTNFKISFVAFPVSSLMDTWGDGDTDLSHGEFGMHFGMPQNRFVTFNDVRMIMRSVVTGIPLDSVRGRQAYHADVDHDGRFYSIDTVVWKTNSAGFFVDAEGFVLNYNTAITRDGDGNITSISHTFYEFTNKEGPSITPEQAGVVLVNTKTRGNILQRSKFWQQDLPPQVTSLNQVHFTADEHDAYWIIDYLAVKVPELPWIYNWKNEKGKVTYTEPVADNISFGEPIKQGNNKYKIPVISNGIAPEGFSTVFEFDTKINQIEVNVDSYDTDFDVYADYHNNRAAIVGSGEFTKNEPYAYIYVETEKDEIVVSGTRYNNNNTSNTTIKLNKRETLENVIDVYPNPAVVGENTTITLNIENNNYYNVDIFDVFGNLVANVYSGDLNVGVNQLQWNGINNTGKACTNGTYIVRVSNADFNAVSKIILTK